MDAPVEIWPIISKALICVGLYTGAALVFGTLLAVVIIKADDLKRTARPRRRHLKIVPVEENRNGQEKE